MICSGDMYAGLPCRPSSLRSRRVSARDAEVDDLDQTFGQDHQVRRADVAMNDVEQPSVAVAKLVRGMQSSARLSDDGSREVGRHRLTATEKLTNQAGDGDPRRYSIAKKNRTPSLTDVEDLDDVVVVDLGRDARENIEEASTIRTSLSQAEMSLSATGRNKPPSPV